MEEILIMYSLPGSICGKHRELNKYGFRIKNGTQDDILRHVHSEFLWVDMRAASDYILGSTTRESSWGQRGLAQRPIGQRGCEIFQASQSLTWQVSWGKLPPCSRLGTVQSLPGCQARTMSCIPASHLLTQASPAETTSLGTLQTSLSILTQDSVPFHAYSFSLSPLLLSSPPEACRSLLLKFSQQTDCGA